MNSQSPFPLLFRRPCILGFLSALCIFAASANFARADDEWGGGSDDGSATQLPPFEVNGNDPATFDWAGYEVYETTQALLAQSNDSGNYLDGSNVSNETETGGSGSGPNLAANPFVHAVNGSPITNAQAAQKFKDAMDVLKTTNPALATLIAQKTAANQLNVDQLAKLGLQVRNTADNTLAAKWTGGVYNPQTNTMTIVINSLTSPQEIAAVLVHEMTHMQQDLVNHQDTSNTPQVDLEAPAWHAQYDFMKSQGMDVSMFSSYVDGSGNWSDSQFKTSYTNTNINTGNGGTWEQTGKYYQVQNHD